MPWSELMKRTLGINVLQCPLCQATMLPVDPDPDERGPPTQWDLVDPPAPEM